MLIKTALYLLIFSLTCCAQAPRVLTPEEIQQRKNFLAKIEYLSHDKLIEDLREIRANNYTKGTLETTQEFENRKLNGFKKYLHNGYIIRIDINNPNNEKEKLVYYDPDKSVLIITMPKRQQSIIFLGKNHSLVHLHYSFLKIDIVSQIVDSYVASNALGMKKEIAKLEEDANGIAILNSVGDFSSQPQYFIVHMERNRAIEILKSGAVEIYVFVDLQYVDLQKENILHVSGDSIKPTMENPYDVNINHYGIPVRLVSLKLIGDGNSKIAEWEGQQIFSSSISN